MHKIYVGCGLTQAPEEFRQYVQRFKEKLKGLPNIEVLEFLGLVNGTAAQVYQTDMASVERCDMFVAICEYPSTGLGMEIEHARVFNKPTLCLHFGATVTRMLIGAHDLRLLELRAYRVLTEDGFRTVKEFIARRADRALAVG